MELDLVREAHRITANLARPRRAVYWADLALTSLGAWGGLALAAQGRGWMQLAGALLCIVALYRGVSFIHEITHLRARDVPGFGFVWNAIIGVPFLAPSLLYEGVHNLHHAKQRYGTSADPEYLPLSDRPPIDIVVFAAIALLAPVGTYLRFAIGTPLSLIAPSLRKLVVARFSAMTINPAFQREDLERAATPAWRAQEVACWLWSWFLTALVIGGGLGARYVLTGAVLLAIVTFVNQLRTLVAHAWSNDGPTMTFAEQFRDSINVPPPALLPLLWAPVGLRYHALHHLLPRIPYHNLGEAHRRLVEVLPAGSTYHAVQQRGLTPPLRQLLARSRASAARRPQSAP